jgi:UDP-N-acetylmuramoyl-tripeptide--D-alanyl-D-alanine ligase
MELSLLDVLEATGGELASGPRDVHLATYHTDSREVRPGGLFFALKGAALDGHAFCADAAARGAAAVVVERELAPPGAAVVRVGDSWRALYALAGYVLRRVSPLVVGVTGSNGKTSTKELAAAVLSVRHRVLKTTGNLNTETGLPLTLLGLEPSHTAAVLEMGMQRPGEIARLAALARPVVGIVTMVGTVHMEHFPSQEALARAKGELVAALPASGLAVLNAEDRWFDLLSGLSAAPVVSYGLGAGDLLGEDWAPLPEGGSRLKVEAVPVRLHLAGRHQASNALAALAAGRFAGVPLREGATALARVRVPHRLEERATPGGYTLIDDAYNASPESMLAAFDLIAGRRPSGRRVALLGEMRELGRAACDAHEDIGRRARAIFDRVAVVDGGHGRLLAAAAAAELLPNREAAAEWVRAVARPGDVVLVKGSHGVALHEVVQQLIATGKKTEEDPVGFSGGRLS